MTVELSTRILIVDDDEHVGETLELIFLARGYKTRMAHSAEDAIEMIAGWEPSLAVIDVMLPRMNGIQLREVLQSNYPNCQVILMSGHPGTADLLESTRRDGQPLVQILAKPLHPTHLLELVAGMLPGVTGEA
jgi:DNA-binding NtrC family response regulator